MHLNYQNWLGGTKKIFYKFEKLKNTNLIWGTKKILQI